MEYEIHHRERFVEVVTHGDGEVEVFQEFLSEVLRHPDWKPGIPILIDHSDLNVGPLTVDGMMKLANMIDAARVELGSSRMAIFVPGDLGYGLGRMWQVYIEGKWDGASELFRSKEDALYWLTHD
jgi:hypothetical protein